MKQKKKQFLVIGLGRFGASVARTLCELGHEVLAIDDDEDAVEALSPFVTQAVQANAADDGVLESLDAGSYDAAIVSIGSDVRASILISVLCKEAGIPMVLAKAMDDLHAKVLAKVGVDRVIFPERDMGQRVARALVSPRMLEQMTMGGDSGVAEVLLPESWGGRTLEDINVRRNYHITILAVRRDGQMITSLGADFRLQPGDTLLVLGEQEDIDGLEEL